MKARFVNHTIEAFVLIASDSDDSKAYFVARHYGGRITCTCPHYKNKLSHHGKLCKHGIKAKKENLFGAI
jgi:predicted nucleic acid-binding Zn finger protein